MDTLHGNITKFFEDLLDDVRCQRDTKAYIISIYGKFKSSEFAFPNDSITSLFAQARNNQDFLTYQNLGDWIFFVNTLAPQHFKYASKEYYDMIARSSYYSCYKLINRQWKLFEELSDNFLVLESQVKERLSTISFSTQTSAGTYIPTCDE